MAQHQAFQQAQSRRVLQQSPGLSNFDAQFGPIYGSTDPHGPDTAFISRATEAIFPGLQAMEGLRRAAGLNQELATGQRAASLRDNRRFGFDELDLQADLEDIASERGAGRAFLPGASALHGRERRETGEDIFGRYVVPEQMKAEGALDAAGIAAEGRTNAAGLTAQGAVAAARSRAMMEGLNNAIREFIRANKQPPSAQQLAAIRQSLGMAVPATAPNPGSLR